MHRRLAPVAAAVVAIILITAPPTTTVVAAQTPVPYTTVTAFAPASGTPTPGVWYEADMRYGGSGGVVDLAGLGGTLEAGQPLPTGAARLTTPLMNTAKAEVGVANNFGVLGDIINTLRVGYSWHKATVEGGNLNAAPSLKLTFYNPVCDQTSGAVPDCYATLVYEPYMNGFGNFPAPDVWQRSDLDANTGGWWTTGGFGHPNGLGGCGAATCPTLAQWFASSSPDFRQATLIDVRVGVGTYNPGQTGYFDDVTIAGTAADASYDFNPPVQFTSVGECVSFLIAKNCAALKGRDRATCNHAQQMTCFDVFGVK
jgi:hypothetical protein